MWPFADRWQQAQTFTQFLEASAASPNASLWQAVYRLSRVAVWAVEAAMELPGRYRLVALSEDWCGDAVNTIPVLAKWTERATNIELRLLGRDAHPDIMDRYLTGTARSIPVVIGLDENMTELGWWGPRPRELQAWTMQQRAAGVDKKTLYPEIRKWYARDKGETTLREVLQILGAETLGRFA
jgi:hypothetical protein